MLRFSAALAVSLLLFAVPITASETDSQQSGKVSRAPEAARDDDSGSYVAERAIFRDATSGALRKPSPKETSELVRSLKTLTKRGELKATTTGDGTGVVELDGQYQMVIVARAAEDGTYETLCVSSFEEAAEFLGLKRSVAPTEREAGEK